MDTSLVGFGPLDTHRLLLNPRETEAKKNQFYLAPLSKYKPFYWLSTSGSLGHPKLVGLSYETLCLAAKNVCVEFGLCSSDRWLLALPLFHVSGLSILARCYISGAKVFHYNRKWNPSQFCNQILEDSISHTSLVPTQVFDILNLQLRAPQCLKKVFVGGASLPQSLCVLARELGWNLVLCYGMTETAAFFSYYENTLESSEKQNYQTMSNIKIGTSSDGLLTLDAPCLAEIVLQFDGYKWVETFNKTTDKVYITSDRINLISSNEFQLLGRSENQKKVLGEFVDLYTLNYWFNTNFNFLGEFKFTSHPRKGHEVYFETDFRFFSHMQACIRKMNSELKPFERAQFVVYKTQKLMA